MNTLIPLLFISLVFYMASMYAYVVFMRRQLMLKRVLRLIERQDVPESIKNLAAGAFEDTLSFGLPISLYFAKKTCKSLSNEEQKALDKTIQDWEKNPAVLEELLEIIDIMFQLNRKISWPSNILVKIISLVSDIREVPDNNLYINTELKHQH